MSERELPPPSTTVEIYLAAVLEELRALNRRPQLRKEDNGVIDLNEPVKVRRGRPPRGGR